MIVGRAVRVGIKLLVRDRNSEVIAERLENVESEFLHLVNSVASLKRVSETVTLHRLREDDGWLTLVAHRFGVGGVQFAVIVPAALERPDFVIGPVSDHCRGARVASEEVLPNVGSGLGLVGLKVAVGSVVHEVAKRAVVVLAEKFVPLATPHDLDDVPPGSAEERFEFLNDLAVAAHGTVEALQVAVDDKREVVESVVRCEL